MALSQAERSLLARIGFFLCRDGEVAEAEAIFTGLAVSAPEKDGPAAGLALCMVIKGENEAAVAMLDERLRAGSGIAPTLSLYKLVALGMAGNLPQALELRRQIERDGMTGAVGTADLLLADLELRGGP